MEGLNNAAHSSASRCRLPRRAVLRAGVTTDNGCPVLDVHGLEITDPVAMEREVNQWPGVVTVGLFARHRASVCLFGTAHGVEASRLTVQGFGSDEPADPSATPEGRARNRRVEIQIAPRDPPVRAPRSPRRWVPEGCPDTPPVRSGPCP
jgi:hypothetical protein